MCFCGTETDVFKKAAELQNSHREMKRKCSNQQYFRFPGGRTEALAYEAHINRKNAYPEITRIKSLGDINRQLQTSLDSVQMLAVNSPAVEVCGTTSKASYSFWCEGEIIWFLKI